MKKFLFVIIIITCTCTFIPHQRIETKTKNYNVYIKEGNTYVKSDTNEMPKTGYILNTTESSCTGGATISQDFNSREVSVTATKETKCNFYFDEYNPNIVEVKNDNRYDTSTVDVIDNGTIGTGNDACTNTVAYDGTTDNNLRYVGANPCNYVTFNGESPSTGTKWVVVQLSDNAVVDGPFENQNECQTSYERNGSPQGYECQIKTVTTGGWRIIGVMNNVDDGTGNLETRVKLIRKDALGDYSWDTSASNVNSGWGVNDWTQADLKNELNGDYLNTSLNANTNWYNGTNNSQSATFDYTKRLSASAQSLIGDAKWYLGGASCEDVYTSCDDVYDYSVAGEGTAMLFYEYERGTKVWGSSTGQTCDDGACPRSTSWTGKVALAYPSDYGYAVGENVRSICLEKKLENYESNNCHSSQWLLSYGWGWLISPYSEYSGNVLYFSYYEGLSNNPVTASNKVIPAVYLKSGVTISGGNGSPENPYVIG